jgi:hypothetical protein
MQNEPQFAVTQKGRAYIDAASRPRACAVNPFAVALAFRTRRAAAAPPRAA